MFLGINSRCHSALWASCAITWLALGSIAHAEVASVYGGSDGFCGGRTASGERLNCGAMTAAHRSLPFGTRVRVCHSGCVVVRRNDRGPFVTGRNIDVSPSCGSGNRAKSYRPRYDYSFLASNRAPILAAAKHNGRACARPLRSQCCYLRREPRSHRITGASPDSGFDIPVRSVLGDPHVQRTVHEHLQ